MGGHPEVRLFKRGQSRCGGDGTCGAPKNAVCLALMLSPNPVTEALAGIDCERTEAGEPPQRDEEAGDGAEGIGDFDALLANELPAFL